MLKFPLIIPVNQEKGKTQMELCVRKQQILFNLPSQLINQDHRQFVIKKNNTLDMPFRTLKLRNITVNKLINIIQANNLGSCQLHAGVSIMDRILTSMDLLHNEQKEGNLCSVQLLGVTCLYIAIKFQQIKHPALYKYLYTANSFFEKEIQKPKVLEMEQLILKILDFDIYEVTALGYVNIYFQLIRKQENKKDKQLQNSSFRIQKCYNLAQYLVQLMLIRNQKKHKQFSHSLLALCSLKLSSHFFLRQYHEFLNNYSQQTHCHQQIKQCDQHLFGVLIRASKKKRYQQIYHKYCMQKYGSVALDKFMPIKNRKQQVLNKKFPYSQQIQKCLSEILQKMADVEEISSVNQRLATA